MKQQPTGEDIDINEKKSYSVTTGQEYNPENNQPVMNTDQHEDDGKQPLQKQEVNSNEEPQNNAESSGGSSSAKLTPSRKNWNTVTGGIHEKKKPIDKNPSKETSDQSIEDLIKKLTASFTAQQDAIINHRKALLRWFACITAIQLLAINVLIFICIFNDKVLGDKQILDAFLDFIKYFIGATFLELMGGLLIIVNYVFSREAYDMLKHLTRVDPSENGQK